MIIARVDSSVPLSCSVSRNSGRVRSSSRVCRAICRHPISFDEAREAPSRRLRKREERFLEKLRFDVYGARQPLFPVVASRHSTERPVYGQQEGSAYKRSL